MLNRNIGVFGQINESLLSNVVCRFMVRDFQYNDEEMKADKEEMTRLSTDKKKQFVCPLCYCFQNYLADSAQAYLKTVRLWSLSTPKWINRIFLGVICVFSGAAGAMVESKLQRSIHCLDTYQSPAGVCGVCLEVNSSLPFPIHLSIISCVSCSLLILEFSIHP